MIDYSTLWSKANEVFYTWEQNEYPDIDTPLSDADRMIFCAGWIQGYLFLNQVEVCNG